MSCATQGIRIRPVPAVDPPYESATCSACGGCVAPVSGALGHARPPTTSLNVAYQENHHTTRAGHSVQEVDGTRDTRGTQGMLPLRFQLPSGVAAVPEETALKVTGSAGSGQIDTDTSTGADPASHASPLPPARPWACRFTQALVEVLAGIRPAAQLIRWTSRDVYEDIRRRTSETGAASDVVRGQRARRVPSVRSVRLFLPRDGVTEVCAVILGDERARALALRFEAVGGRWLCTELELG